jgi:hypothetical protein
MMRALIFPAFAIAMFCMAMGSSCGPKERIDLPVTDTTQTYFPIKGFIKDQVELLSGQPYVLNQYVTLNGKTDSMMVSFYSMDLGSVLKTFLATDISNPKYFGHYKFSAFDENTSGNRVMMYEALEKDLFTRNFTLTIDPANNKILSVYTETEKKSIWRELRQRLLYIPLKVIQIQEDESALFSKTRNLRVEYRFLQ